MQQDPRAVLGLPLDATRGEAQRAFRRLAKQTHPDAIILDFQMPFVNGAGFLYRLREEDRLRHTPVLVVTGETLTHETRRALKTLDADVRLKPIGIADLVSAADSLVNAERSAATQSGSAVG